MKAIRKKRMWLSIFVSVLALIVLIWKPFEVRGQQHDHSRAQTNTQESNIPQSLKKEHQELHEELAAAVKVTGPIGKVAGDVAGALHPHFLKEEELALPQLGLLPLLAKGEVRQDMKDYVAMSEKLKAELPEMLQEHKAIVATLEKLKEAARAENKPQYEHYAEKLMLHAQMEEEVFYPTAILVGEYLKLKLHH